MAPVELMKLFNIGNALNTGYNQIKRPVLTDEDILLEPGALPDLALGATEEISFEGNSPFMRNQINERIIAAENKYYEQGKMPPEFLGDKIRMNMELGNYDGYMGPGFEDGGRVGLFMGGSPLEGEALSIYNSMKAYGNDDQAIADRLQALGMYTPQDSTPDPTPDQGIINQQLNQGGGDGPKGDFGIFGNLLKDTAKDFNVQVYDEELGDFIDTKITGYKNVNSGLYQDKFGKNLQPAFSNKGQVFGLAGIVAQALGLTPDTVGGYVPGSIKGKYDGIGDMFSNVKNPFSIFQKQQATLADINAMNKKAVDELRAKQAAEKAAKEAAIAAEMAKYNITSGSDFGGGTPGGGGGNVTTKGGDVYGGAAYGYNEAAEKTDYYKDGGLATMFTRRR